MLKTAQFENKAGQKVGVAYSIFKNNLCVFSGIEDDSQGSTINHAEEIALAIAEQERREVSDFRFFDLQARGSYGSNFSKFQPGDFEFEEVIFEPCDHKTFGFNAASWRLVECPEYVAHEFLALIDGEPRQVVMRDFESTF